MERRFFFLGTRFFDQDGKPEDKVDGTPEIANVVSVNCYKEGAHPKISCTNIVFLGLPIIETRL